VPCVHTQIRDAPVLVFGASVLRWELVEIEAANRVGVGMRYTSSVYTSCVTGDAVCVPMQLIFNRCNRFGIVPSCSLSSQYLEFFGVGQV
jgi:hypothetical protein